MTGRRSYGTPCPTMSRRDSCRPFRAASGIAVESVTGQAMGSQPKFTNVSQSKKYQGLDSTDVIGSADGFGQLCSGTLIIRGAERCAVNGGNAAGKWMSRSSSTRPVPDARTRTKAGRPCLRWPLTECPGRTGSNSRISHCAGEDSPLQIWSGPRRCASDQGRAMTAR